MLSIQELRSSNRKELHLELQKARKETLKVRISLKTKHEKDTSKAGKARRYIARILMAIKELDREEAKPSSAKASGAPASEAVAKKPGAKKA